MKNITTRVLAVVLGLAAAAVTARAEGPAFNAAGDTLWSPGREPGTLTRTDVATGKSATIEVQDEDGSKPRFIAIAPGGGADFWLLSESVLWSWREGAATAEVAGGVEGANFYQMASGDGGKRLLVNDARGELWSWSTDDRQFRVVEGQNLLGGIYSPCFLGDGTFLFACYGDLWHGRVGRDEGDEAEFPLRLWAYRMAPLAERSAAPGTPAQIGVNEIALAHGKVYVSVGRMGGTGWGHVARLNLPAPMRGEWTDRNSTKDIIAALRSVEKVIDNFGYSHLCATRDGGKLHLLGEDLDAHLLGPEGEPVKMKTPDPR